MPEDAHDDTERLEATRREIERLVQLRRDVANGLLEVSKAAKRDAEQLLTASADTIPTGEVEPSSTGVAPSRAWPKPVLYGSFGLGLLCGFILAVFLRSPATGPVDEVAVVAQSPPEVRQSEGQSETSSRASLPEAAPTPAPTPAPAPPPLVVSSAAADRDGGLVLTLRTTRACWLSIRVDNGETAERLLPPDETVVLQVEEEAVLRVGDAAALSLFINDEPARPLGRDGQVIELRITPSNYQTFLAGA